MYHQKKILALIPARGGSKGIKCKNMAPLCGKPLIYYSIRVALELSFIDRVVVSSDDEHILAVAQRYGAAALRRPKNISQNSSKMSEAVRHALDKLSALEGFLPDFILLLQPTSPLRLSATVSEALQRFCKYERDFDSLIPLKKIDGKIGLIKRGRYLPMQKLNQQRQALEPLYQECGTVFIFKTNIVQKGGFYGKKLFPYIIKDEREALDIDTESDLELAAYYLKQKKHERDKDQK